MDKILKKDRIKLISLLIDKRNGLNPDEEIKQLKAKVFKNLKAKYHVQN